MFKGRVGKKQGYNGQKVYEGRNKQRHIVQRAPIFNYKRKYACATGHLHIPMQ